LTDRRSKRREAGFAFLSYQRYARSRWSPVSRCQKMGGFVPQRRKPENRCGRKIRLPPIIAKKRRAPWTKK
jgi:hypothetical protein